MPFRMQLYMQFAGDISMVKSILGVLILRLPLAPILLACVASFAADAAPAQLDWKDLLPSAQVRAEAELIDAQEQLWALPDAAREGFYDVAFERSVREGLRDGSISSTEMTDEDRAILQAAPAERYPQAIAYWQRVAKLRARFIVSQALVATQLDGQQVRLPGYVLPLEFEGSKVREFLLVPYVGACIHTPTPPLNQIVLVRPKVPFTSAGMYAPVWIEGELSAEKRQSDLELVDGQAAVQSGYTMLAADVQSYKK